MPTTIVEQQLLWDGSPRAVPCDGERNVESRPTVISMGQETTLRLVFRDRATFEPRVPETLADAQSLRFELRDRLGVGFTVLYATGSVAVDVEAHEITVDCARTYTEELEAALGERAAGTFAAMLSGFDAGQNRVFTAVFPLTVANITDSEAVPEGADSLSKQVKALDGRVAELEEHQQDVDDVLFFDTKENPAAGQTAFPLYGEDGKIYGAKDTGRLYRWDTDGEDYVQVGGGDAPVESVNGKTGAVVLSASDVGALPSSAISNYRTASDQDAIDRAQNTAIAAKYTKPSGGIPASDLAAGAIPAVPVKAVKRNGTALTPDANGAVNVEVVISVNGKTGVVELNGGSIPIAVETTTTVLEALQQVLSKTNLKQDAISDLAAIRSGAAAGATAVQPSELTNYVQKSQTAGLLKNDGTVDTTQYMTEAPVLSVNGKTGDVVLDADDIPFDGSDPVSSSVASYISGIEHDLDGKLDAVKRNLLAYASTTTLAPQTAVYRSALNADGTFPTITDTGITTAAAYYQFELELTVPSTVPSTITGPTGWTWLDGHGLPDPADLSGGETVCISVRLDCTARTFLASVWRVA